MRILSVSIVTLSIPGDYLFINSRLNVLTWLVHSEGCNMNELGVDGWQGLKFGYLLIFGSLFYQ